MKHWFQLPDAHIIARYRRVITNLIQRYNAEFKRPNGRPHRYWALATNVANMANRRFGYGSGWASPERGFVLPGGFPEGFDPWK